MVAVKVASAWTVAVAEAPPTETETCWPAGLAVGADRVPETVIVEVP